MFTDLFLFVNKRWGCHENKLGLLSFRANAESFFFPYRLQVKIFGCCNKNSEVFMYKVFCKAKFHKTIEAMHKSKLTEVNSLSVLHTSRGRFIILTIAELLIYIIVINVKRILVRLVTSKNENHKFMFKKTQLLLFRI